MAPRITKGGDWDDLGMVLHEEVDRLPDRYRTPVVLCYFEGLTHEQAAGQLGWPVGTVRTRLSKASGWQPVVEPRVGPDGRAAGRNRWRRGRGRFIPPALAVATVRAALLHAAGESIAGVVPASAVAMAERGLKMMSLTRWKAIAFTLMTIGGGTAGVVASRSPGSRHARARSGRRAWRRRSLGLGMIEHGMPRRQRGSRRPDRRRRADGPVADQHIPGRRLGEQIPAARRDPDLVPSPDGRPDSRGR